MVSHNNPDIAPFGLTYADWVAIIFDNDGNGNFTRKEGSELPAIGHGSHAWGDIDGNGFLDLVIQGDGHYNGDNALDASAWYHRVFANNNNVFSEVSPLPELDNSRKVTVTYYKILTTTVIWIFL